MQQNEFRKCAVCGSEYFWETEYRQYYARRFASQPGGELMASSLEVRVRVCLCGDLELKFLRSLPPDEQEAVTASMEKARRYRERSQPEYFKDAFRKAFVPQAQFEKLLKKVSGLTKVVDGLRKETEEE